MSLSAFLLAGIVLFSLHPVRSSEHPPHAPRPHLSPQWFLRHELTRPPGLCVWETMKELELCDAGGLRALARDVREMQRHGNGLGAAPLVMEAAAERDPAGTLSDILSDLKKAASIVAPRTSLEGDAVLLACRMVGHDWKKLVVLLDSMNRDAGALPFWRLLAAEIDLPPERVPAFLTTAVRGMDERHWPDIAGRVLWTTVKHHGVTATAKTLKTIRSRSVRTAAEEALRMLMRDPPFPPSPLPDKSPPLKSPALQRLHSLDTAPDESRLIPFPLLRAVRRLTPAEALTLARELPRDPAPPGHWLAWMLFMRAAEGAPMAAEPVAAETGGQLIRAGQSTATLFALRPELDAETGLREIRDIASPDAQRQALSGFLTCRAAQKFILGQQGNPLMAFATQIKLPAASWRAGLCQAAASGGGEAAWQLAQHLPWESPVGRALLQEDIIKAWALTDLRSLRAWAETLTNPDELKPVTAALAFLEPFPGEAID